MCLTSPGLPAGTTAGTSEQGKAWVGEDSGDICQELRALLPVDETVVEGHRQLSDPARLDALVNSTADYPGLPADGSERQDRGFAWVEDRRAGVHAEYPDVRDGDRAAAHVRRRGLARSGRFGELADSLREPEQRQLVGVLDVGHYQTAVGRRRDAEVHVVLVDDLASRRVPEGIDLRRALCRE